MTRFSIFHAAYLEAMAFTELGDSEQPPHGSELTPESVKEARHDCLQFFQVNGPLFVDQEEQAGRDFWFTRQGHGVGFWDRPEVYGDEMDELDESARAFGEVYLEWEEVTA